MENRKTEWSAFLQMPLKKKIAHIQMYYSWVIIASVFVVICLVSVGKQFAYNMREPMISGIFINTTTSQEGYRYVKEDYLHFCGDGKRRVELVQARSLHTKLEEQTQDDDAVSMILSSMISARSLDYLICDTSVMEFMDSQGMLLDLRSLFTEEELAAAQVFTSTTGTIGICLNGSDFASTYTLSAPDSYLTVISNTPSPEKTAAFIRYLLPEKF